MSIASADDVQLDTQLYTMIELEANRYRAFFAKLSVNECSISRDVALEFFRKSKLSEEQVQELYSRLKGLRLLQERERVNETEFVMGMHFIVCMTKRNLVKIPPTFPSYLFPSLDLTSEFPSSDPFDSSTAPLGPNPPISIITTSTMTLGTPLSDAQSLSDLVTTELRNKQHEVEVLSRVQHSEMRALQSLHACVERIADQVDRLGFPVPNSSRSLEVLDDLRNLLQKHILAAKQEIQSIQIDAQMRSVASEVAQESGPREDPLNVSCSLTQELIALQHQTSQLMTKKTDVIERLVAVKTGGSAAGSILQQSSGSTFTGGVDPRNPTFALSKGALTVGELGTASASTTPPKDAEPSLMQSQNRASSGEWGTFGADRSHDPPSLQPFGTNVGNPLASNDPFAFGSAPPAVGTKSTETPGPKSPAAENDFAWGSFQ